MQGREIELDAVVASRRIEDEKAREAAFDLAERLRDRPEEKRLVLEVVTLVPSQFESALWLTLREVVARGTLKDFVQAVNDNRRAQSFGKVMAELLPSLGVSVATAARWAPRDTGPGGVVIARPPGDPVIVGPFRSVADLSSDRRVEGADALSSVRAVTRAVGNDRAMLELVNEASALIPERYNDVLWPTLRRVIERDRLEQFVKVARQAAVAGAPAGLAIAAHAQQLKLTAALRTGWSDLDLGRE